LLRLLQPHHERAARLARQLARTSGDGDDLYQEAVLRAFRGLDSLRDESRFGAWFHAVLLSVHRSRARRGFWRRFQPLEREPEGTLDPPDPAGVTEEDRQRAARASLALATLPAVQREAVVLFELEGYSIEEIAAMQQVSVPAVKSRLQRGRDRLRRRYERMLPARRPDAARPPGTERPLQQGGTS
jgi:RNA polymerase sigma-70 factor (ECF subfamily)